MVKQKISKESAQKQPPPAVGSNFDFPAPLNPFWVHPIMKKARKNEASVREATKYYTGRSHEHRESFDRQLRTFIRHRLERSPESTSANALALLWFLLTKYNQRESLKLGLTALSLTIFRVGYLFCFTQVLAGLADNPAGVVFLGASLPPLALSVATFSLTCLISSWLAYRLDQNGTNLGNQCRLQLIWSVQAATMRSNQTLISGFTSSEVVSLAGTDGMIVMYVFSSVYYIFAVPIEVGVLMWLSATQLGALAGLVSLLPLAVLLAVKIVLIKLTIPKERYARTILSKRFGILSESIVSNLVVKVMGLEPTVLCTMGRLRKIEQNQSMLFACSNAVSLLTQVIAAPAMGWMALRVRSRHLNPISSEAIMAVLGYYRTITTYDMYKIVMAVQTLSLAMVSANKYMIFFALEHSENQQDTTKIVEESASKGPDKRTIADFTPLAEFSDAAFTWKAGTEPTLNGLSFTLDRGKLIGVCGPMASGKSSLLLALLGELHCTVGSARMSDTWTEPVAYSPQKYWLQTGTVRENICFAEPMSSGGSDWLEQVVECCGLDHDVAAFGGLDHDIGEEGTSLSGGQKARLSLARAVYLRASITLLDDPLCALDPVLAAHIFQRVIAPGGLLRGQGRSVVMVTTNAALLSQCDQVLVVKDGTVASYGSFEDLAAAGVLEDAVDVADSSSAIIDYKAELKNKENQALDNREEDVLVRLRSFAWDGESAEKMDARGSDEIKSLDILQEARNSLRLERMLCGPLEHQEREEDEGDISMRISQSTRGVEEQSAKEAGLIAGVDVVPRSSIGALIFAMGWWRACLGGLLIFISQASFFAWQFLLGTWLDENTTTTAFRRIAKVMGFMIVPMGFPAVLGSFIHYIGFLTGSSRLQAVCSSSVVYAPFSFFSVNPAARVFGHISQDSRQVELPLSMTLAGLWLLGAQILGTVVVTCIVMWYLAFLFVPLIFVYYYVQRYYASAVIPLSNLEAEARGPVNVVISTTLAGLPVVRAFRQQPKFERRLRDALHQAGATSSVVIGCKGWISFLSNVVIFGSITIFITILMAVVLDPGPYSFGPVVLSNIMSLSGVIGSTAVLVSNLQNNFTALQRLVQYCDIPSEEEVVRHGGPADDDTPMKSEDSEIPSLDVERQERNLKKRKSALLPLVQEPEKGWPAHGRIEYRNVCAAYVWGIPPALKNVTIKIPAGSSCAIIGRSGSGKTTAFLALAGLIPIVSGSIEIDGVPSDRVSIKRLRAALAVVPQDPVMFSGTIRTNLDPENKHSDAELWNAMRVVGLDQVLSKAGGLETSPVASGMSPGQRQLMCLARAMLRDAVVLLLDEAESSLDAETETLLTETVEKFASGAVRVVGAPKPRTVVQVAHRLRGLLQMNQVVLLSSGQVLEAGVPSELAKNEGGAFHGMLKAQGLE